MLAGLPVPLKDEIQVLANPDNHEQVMRAGTKRSTTLHFTTVAD